MDKKVSDGAGEHCFFLSSFPLSFHFLVSFFGFSFPASLPFLSFACMASMSYSCSIFFTHSPTTFPPPGTLIAGTLTLTTR